MKSYTVMKIYNNKKEIKNLFTTFKYLVILFRLQILWGIF